MIRIQVRAVVVLQGWQQVRGSAAPAQCSKCGKIVRVQPGQEGKFIVKEKDPGPQNKETDQAPYTVLYICCIRGYKTSRSHVSGSYS